MLADSVEYKGHFCFKNDWTGFTRVCPINIIIGRNNTGKSHMLDFVKAMCGATPFKKDWETRCSGILTADILRSVFRESDSGGTLGGSHWDGHGSHMVGSHVQWDMDVHNQVATIVFSDVAKKHRDPRIQQEREKRISPILCRAKSPIASKVFRHLLADRDILPEQESPQPALQSNGIGATNLIRKFLNSSSPAFPRELIQERVREALNDIFAGDGNFLEIEIQQHDHDEAGGYKNHWEVFLAEEHKGLVALSRSGSGLKTIILVLLNLLVIPTLEGTSSSQYVFAFEELENNLHPALLRNLLRYLDKYVQRESSTIFLTTHSGVVLDYFGRSEIAQIVHVSHDGRSAKATPVTAHLDRIGIVSDLGAKPSDLMQANGIIWVEGPSDRIYINRWIDLFSEGQLREGRDYQCAFYGGALLANIQFASEEEALDKLVNLFRINANNFVVCDGDRTSPSGSGSRIKKRVQRIKAEVAKLPSAKIWITEAKEIENYLPENVLTLANYDAVSRAPQQYEHFFPRPKQIISFVERQMRRKSIDKVELATKCVPHMTCDNLRGRFDLVPSIELIVSTIRKWNQN